MFITRTVDIQKTYTLVDWRIYFLLAGIIPLGIAVEKSGASSLITTFVIDYLYDFGPQVILSFLFFVTVMLSAYISNNAVAVLIAPIAISMASELGMDPRPFLLTIIYAANSSFLTPIGYQTNTMIYGVGQFKFKDFLLTGGFMTLIAWIITTVLIPLIYF
jgi:di/tricarboxylate transporter